MMMMMIVVCYCFCSDYLSKNIVLPEEKVSVYLFVSVPVIYMYMCIVCPDTGLDSVLGRQAQQSIQRSCATSPV